MPHHHAHGHADSERGTGPDWAQFAEQLTLGPRLHADVNRETFAWLAGLIGPVSQVLDLGAGTAEISVQLADVFGRARVLAVEDNAELVDLARATVADQARVSVQQGSLPGALEDLPAADLVWLNGVAHHLDDAPAVLARIVGLVRRGGAVVLGEGGLSPQFFPAGPDQALLARTEAARAERAGEHGNSLGIVEADQPWPKVLRRAGCTAVHTRSFLLDRPAPLPGEQRRWVAGRLAMARDFVGDRLSAGDRDRLAALADLASEHGVLRRDDVFVLAANTVHVGLVG